MSTIYNNHKLSKLDITRIKHADDIALDYNGREGLSQLRAIKRGEGSETGYDQTEYIPVDARMTLRVGYGDESDQHPNAKAYEFVNSVQYCARWSTIAGLLREGDEIRLDWSSDQPGDPTGGYSGNAICQLAGYEGQALYRDTLTVVILRNGKAKHTIELRQSLCPANSAQTIKWDGRNW